MSRVFALLAGDRTADRVVPPTGLTARLTLFLAAVMAGLAVVAMAFSAATGRLADRWEGELSTSLTIIVGSGQDADVDAILSLLSGTGGVARARALDDAEQAALLAPWFGADLAAGDLPLPRLVEVVPVPAGLDIPALAARVAETVPGATLDDHGQWRAPVTEAAGRLRALGLAALALLAMSMAAVITLAAQASLAANAGVIEVLRQVGARDVYIARAFVRRFTLRALAGALLGTALAMAALALLPDTDPVGGFLTSLGFRGAEWLLPCLVPPLAAVVAFAATRAAALANLRDLP